MSARLTEAARAFATIAEHLSVEKREALAEKIAGLIDAAVTPTSKTLPSAPRETLPDPVHVEYDEAAAFLVAHGFAGIELVRAAGRLEEFLKHHPHLTRAAGMRRWLTEDVGMSR